MLIICWCETDDESNKDHGVWVTGGSMGSLLTETPRFDHPGKLGETVTDGCFVRVMFGDSCGQFVKVHLPEWKSRPEIYTLEKEVH